LGHLTGACGSLPVSFQRSRRASRDEYVHRRPSCEIALVLALVSKECTFQASASSLYELRFTGTSAANLPAITGAGSPFETEREHIRRNKFIGARVNSDVEYGNHFSAGFPMQSQFYVIPPLSESTQEVPSYVCPASQLHQIFIEHRMVVS
jgi:hypothetical protein